MKPASRDNAAPRIAPWVVVAVLVFSAALRIAFFSLNDRLHGDVNLFAITARELAITGEFAYPMKYEYSESVPYFTLRSPVTQHPPLFPVLGGFVSRILGTDNTFSILKGIDFLAGLLIVLLVLMDRQRPPGSRIAGGLVVGLMPILADYSANGSSLILCALVVLILSQLLGRGSIGTWKHGAAIGLLLAAGYLIHNAMMSLGGAVVVVWWLRRRELNWKCPAIAIAVGLLFLSPFFAWNYRHFGTPMYSSAPLVLKMKLGLAERTIDNDEIVIKEIDGPHENIVLTHWRNLRQSAVDFVLKSLWFLGPAGIILVVWGLYIPWRRSPSNLLFFTMPIVFYTLMILFWAMYKQRFLVPCLTIAGVYMGEGLFAIWNAAKHRTLPVALALILAGWWTYDIFIHGPTRYYFESSGHSLPYEEMRDMWEGFAEDGREGLIMGNSLYLSGGIEGVYWHRQPYIHARYFSEAERERILEDFPVRYIWTDRRRMSEMPGTPIAVGRWFAIVEVDPN